MREKVFISGYITGGKEDYTQDDLDLARVEFDRVEVELKKRGFDTVNPFDLSPIGGNNHCHWMRGCVKALMDCDYQYMLDKSLESKGAMDERLIARMVEIPLFKWRF